MAAAANKLPAAAFLFSSSPHFHHHPVIVPIRQHNGSCAKPVRRIACKATEVSKVEEGEAGAAAAVPGDGRNWVPVVPLSALPRGERRVIIQDGETILLLWYKDEVFAIENRSPAEGAYSEGLLNARLTQVLPSRI